MAPALGPLRERMVFVGGCATGLLLTNPAAAGVRPTEDVDAIIGGATLTAYDAMQPLLAERGFRQTMEAGMPHELAQAEPTLRRHVVEQTRVLLSHPDMQNALPGIVAQPIRTGTVLERLQHIASLSLV